MSRQVAFDGSFGPLSVARSLPYSARDPEVALRRGRGNGAKWEVAVARVKEMLVGAAISGGGVFLWVLARAVLGEVVAPGVKAGGD